MKKREKKKKKARHTSGSNTNSALNSLDLLILEITRVRREAYTDTFYFSFASDGAEGVAAAEAVARGADAGDVLHVGQVVYGGGDEGVGVLGRASGEEVAQLRGRHLVEVERRRRPVE